MIRRCWKGARHYEENHVGLFYIFPLIIELAREVFGEDNERFLTKLKERIDR